MTTPDPEETPFAPGTFFARAAHALGRNQTDATAAIGGDHILNPDLVDDAGIAYREAAVLIPVVAYEPEASVILTVRTGHLSAHAGQIAFPGGKIDAGDVDPVAAALREAGEEIGLDRRAITVVGSLNPYLSRTGYRIVPVLARVEPGYGLSLNRDEVADIFEVPLGFLMTTANHKRGTRAFRGRERYFYEMPFEGRYIWGVTAGIIHGLYEQVYG